MFASTHGWINEQEAFTDEQLQTLVVMFDGALPILGQLPSARRLELVRRHPRIVKQYTSALAPLTKLIQMQHCLVQAALHL